MAVAAAIRRWLQWRRERRELAQLNERELRDIALTPSERMWLVEKPFVPVEAISRARPERCESRALGSSATR
ncbi:MAG TPA: DUF1127 domain-containing protein [Stellaceae bacterium]|nr:DUF1127 domain-containing protein [Stellaceae bacterium]